MIHRPLMILLILSAHRFTLHVVSWPVNKTAEEGAGL